MIFEDLNFDSIQEIMSYLEYDYKTMRNILLLSKKYNKIIKEIVKVDWFITDEIAVDEIYDKFTILRFEQLSNYREKSHILYDFFGKYKIYFCEYIEYTYPGDYSVSQKIKKFYKSYNIIKSERQSLF